MLINPLRLRSMLMGLDLEQQALAKGRAGGGDKPRSLYLKSSSFRVCTILPPVTAAASSRYRYP